MLKVCVCVVCVCVCVCVIPTLSPPDVDECSEGAVCRTQRCENTIGSYRCITSCEPGYRVTRTGECVGQFHLFIILIDFILL